MISVIIPVYQCENTLADCIDSVIAQRDLSVEILLVDDGSTDGSGQLCDRYAEKYPGQIKVIHKANEGPLLARLEGIRCSGGAFLMFLDSDDRFREGAFRRVRKAIKEHQADAVIFNHIRVYEDGSCEPVTLNELETLYEGEQRRLLRKQALITDQLNALWQKCVRRELLADADSFRRLGKMVIGEDKLLSLRILERAERVVLIPDMLYEYRVLAGSVSRSASLRHYQDLSVVHRQLLEYAERWGLMECCLLCHKKKVVQALSCVNQMAEQVRRRQKRFSDFRELAAYIGRDVEFRHSLNVCRRLLRPKQRLFCGMVKNELTYLLFGCIALYGVIQKRPERP